MSGPTGGPLTYSAVSAGAVATPLLTTIEGWMALVIGALTILVLIVRLIIDWPKLVKRLKGKGV
jgi:hypothetical protein